MDAASNDGNPGFEVDIKPLFRQHDRQAMEFAFDLWSYGDVRAHAADISARLQNGSSLRWRLAPRESAGLPAMGRNRHARVSVLR